MTMSFDPYSVVSAVGSSVISTIKIAQTVYELKAVDKQAQSLLSMTSNVLSSIDVARTQRYEKAHLLSGAEKNWMDDVVFPHIQQAVNDVAKLIEPARVDKCTRSSKRVAFRTRVMFLLRVSPEVHTSLTKLSVASQFLTSAMVILGCRDASAGQANNNMHSPRGALTVQSPPSYDESDFRAQHRRRTNSRLRMSSENFLKEPTAADCKATTSSEATEEDIFSESIPLIDLEDEPTDTQPPLTPPATVTPSEFLSDNGFPSYNSYDLNERISAHGSTELITSNQFSSGKGSERCADSSNLASKQPSDVEGSDKFATRNSCSGQSTGRRSRKISWYEHRNSMT